MLDAGLATLQDKERPIVQSDRGAHYRWPGWIDRMNKTNLSHSMSKKVAHQITQRAKGSLDD